MSVRVKLKNVTTNVIQMRFDHVVPLIQVPGDTQKSKNRFRVWYMYVETCLIMALFYIFRHAYTTPETCFWTFECQNELG